MPTLTTAEKEAVENFLDEFKHDPLEAVKKMAPSLALNISEEEKKQLWLSIKENEKLTTKEKEELIDQIFDLILPNNKSDLLPEYLFQEQKKAQELFDAVFKNHSQHLEKFLKIQCFNLRPIIKANYSRIEEKLPETAKLLHKKGYCR